MADMRNRYRVPRRDYNQPEPRRADPPHRPANNPVVTQIPASAPSSKSVGPQPIERKRFPPIDLVQPDTPPSRKRQNLKLKRRRARLAIVFVVLLLFGTAGYLTMKTRGSSFLSTVIKPKNQPSFNIYYPVHPPKGLSVNSSSITSTKDLYTFDLSENGKKSFYITEQPLLSSFNINDFKNKLTSPREIDTGIGRIVIGGLSFSIITGIKTNDNTLIIINCAALECIVPSENLAKSLQKVDYSDYKSL